MSGSLESPLPKEILVESDDHPYQTRTQEGLCVKLAANYPPDILLEMTFRRNWHETLKPYDASLSILDTRSNKTNKTHETKEVSQL